MTELNEPYIEFYIHDAQRFALLADVFIALKHAKENDRSPDADDLAWLQFFDTSAREYFWWPTEAERKEWEQRWFATPIPQRWSEPSLKTPWHFVSMLDAFFNGEFKLIACIHAAPELGRLYCMPYAWPFGGTGCMKALTESFGFHILQEIE